MIDAKALKQQCSGRWFGLYEYFGIDVGTGAHKSCPLCGGKDRFRVERDGSGYYCNQCQPGTAITLVMKHLGINFPEAVRRINEVLNGGYTKMDTAQNNNKMSEADIKKMLNRIWTEAKPLQGSDHVSKYLHQRGLVLTPDNVRFSPELYESDTKKKYPAMVARIVDKDNRPIALHRTYLEPNIAKQAEIQSPKKMTPGLDSLVGCAVRLFEPVDNTLVMCEGIETACACKQIFDIPAWACLSSTILQGFEPPEGIRKVIICADFDANYCGQKAAYTLANRLYLRDYIVEVRLPEVIGDFADELWQSIK